MLETLPKNLKTYNATCSVTDPKDGHVTFIRDAKYLKHLKNVDKDMWVIVPTDITIDENFSKKLKFHKSDYPEFDFTIYHNHLYEHAPKDDPVVGENCDIHPTVIMDVDGLKLVHTPNGEKIQFIHTGRVWIGSDVHIGAYSVIHRSTLGGATVIDNGCKFGVHNNIAHNCYIGKGTVFAVGVILNGGVVIGNNCWVGSGAIIKHYVTIADDVVLGHGTVVTKDITESGIYVGNPARYLKSVEGGFNF